jgi:DIM1 family U5 snRNP protein
MAYLLPHLNNGWEVDQAIVTEQEKVVCIRFGRDADSQCMLMDETLAGVCTQLTNFCTIYVVDITRVPDFNEMYELTDPVSVMFFYRNKHIQIDLGTGNNNKITWPITEKQEFIDLAETVFRGAAKGRGLVVAPRDYSTKNRY